MNASEDLEAVMAESENSSPRKQPPSQQPPDAASHFSSSVLEADSVSLEGNSGKRKWTTVVLIILVEQNSAQDDDDWYGRDTRATRLVETREVADMANRDGSLSSVTSSILDYEFENGRRYHAYKAGRESPLVITSLIMEKEC